MHHAAFLPIMKWHYGDTSVQFCTILSMWTIRALD